jgi:hypothetical protein
MEPELAKFTAVELRLREVVRTIVRQRAAHGTPLSWRLMFEIEDEVMTLLNSDSDLDGHYIRMVTAPSAPPERRTDQPVGLADSYVMHTVLWMIQEAYCQAH